MALGKEFTPSSGCLDPLMVTCSLAMVRLWAAATPCRVSDLDLLLCASSTDGKCLVWDPWARGGGHGHPVPVTGFVIPRKKANRWMDRDSMLEGDHRDERRWRWDGH